MAERRDRASGRTDPATGPHSGAGLRRVSEQANRFELSISETTVKAHVTAILRKLGAQSRTQAVRIANSASFAQISARVDFAILTGCKARTKTRLAKAERAKIAPMPRKPFAQSPALLR
jgi:hypothetical protein